MDRELYVQTDEMEAEDAWQSALGNSFHTTTVAALLGTILFHKGSLPCARGPDVLLQRFIAEDAEGSQLQAGEGHS